MIFLYLTAGSVFFVSSFIILRSYLRVHLAAKYENTEDREEAAITVSLRLVSACQAIMASCVGILTIVGCSEDIMYDVSPLLIPYCTFGVSYMIYDIWAMFAAFTAKHRHLKEFPLLQQLKPFLKQNGLIAFHHLAIVLLGYPILFYFRNGKGDFFMGCLMLTELSTPFISFKYIIRKMKWNIPNVVLINDLIFMVLFFICRILIFPFMFSAYARYKHISTTQVLVSISKKCIIGCLVILTVQFIWFRLIVLAAIKRLRSYQVETDEVRGQKSVEVNFNHVSHKD